MKEKKYDHWYKGTKNEDDMELSHSHHWKKFLNSLDKEDLENFKEKVVLDFGCNQGGFLRFLYNKIPFKNAIGIDLATKAIEIANKRKKNYPIEYVNTAHPEKFDEKFDIAFSSSVIYLIEDLNEHAKIINQSLKKGGVYYTNFTDYNGNPNLNKTFKTINKNANLLMQLHSLDDIAESFINNGFSASIIKMKVEDYIPIELNDPWYSRLSERIYSEYNNVYVFKFVKDIDLIEIK